ncbi:nucleoside phosphatase GDA1/CD39 [Melampsora americana]|nr:nucleoside phosphatase GDA1/CD39 [Melampsora americana]
MAFIRKHIIPFTFRKTFLLLSIPLILIYLLYHSNRSSINLNQFHSTSNSLFNSKPSIPSICIAPPGQSNEQFALMIDAGSTGSRIHVYRFSRCLPNSDQSDSLPRLIDEEFIKTQPGLSAFHHSPQKAAQSLKILLDSAMKSVPEKDRSCTPISLKATAGLRLLGETQSSAIIKEVERYLREEWPFSVAKDAVSIMDGSAEGVYAWVTINYLLKRIGPQTSIQKKHDTSTAAVLDLGGASTQIVFEPLQVDQKPILEPGDHVYDLKFGGRHHALYQHSHLGYGLMEARRSIHNLVAFNQRWKSQHSSHSKDKVFEIFSPCLIKDGRKKVELEPDQLIEIVGTGAGFDACRRLVEIVMAKDDTCPLKPCAFGGVYQPRLEDSFKTGPIYALSYFYDRIEPLGLKSPFKLNRLKTLTESVCKGKRSNGRWIVLDEFKPDDQEEAIKELEDRPEYCLDLSFMYSLLSFGYEVKDDREIVISKKINGVELGWALGAAIAMIDGKVECRA